MNQNKIDTKLILFLYHDRTWQNQTAQTIKEMYEAFDLYGSYNYLYVNTALGFPSYLRRFHFKASIMHFSAFEGIDFTLGDPFIEFISGLQDHYSIALFQDEDQHCQERFKVINDLGLNCVYSCLNQKDASIVYGENTCARDFFSMIPSYINSSDFRQSRAFIKPDQEREIDIFYRARPVEWNRGKGGQEKTQIAEVFLSKLKNNSLNLDISIEAKDRIYGKDWQRALSNSKASLGVESGTSIFDVKGTIYKEYKSFLQKHSPCTFEDVWQAVLKKHENQISYRTISHRHFEAINQESCQILIKGNYSGILEAGRHYIALEKDYSNFDEVIEQFKDKSYREKIIKQSYKEIIISEKYTLPSFIKVFEKRIKKVISLKTDKDHLSSLLQNTIKEIQQERLKEILNELKGLD